MLNEPRRGGQSTGRRWSAKHGTPAKSMLGTTTPKGWQNDNFIHFISLLCHPFGVVDFISSSSRGYASLHHLPVVVPALRASLHNRLPYKTNYSFVRQFYFRNLRRIIWKKNEKVPRHSQKGRKIFSSFLRNACVFFLLTAIFLAFLFLFFKSEVFFN